MKTRARVHGENAEKLRGGFYTPDALVDRCLARVDELGDGRAGLRVLEPSAGDGAFLRGLARSPLRASIESIVAVEVIACESRRLDGELDQLGLEGRAVHASAIDWAATTEERFDIAVGNPPFLRFQFVDALDRRGIDALGSRLGVTFAGVANLWLPVLLGALDRLRPGGTFAFVVPAECLTGVSAAVLRAWVLEHTAELRFDLFPPGSFPGVLQEVVVLSGRRAEPHSPSRVAFCQHHRSGRPTTVQHAIADVSRPWTRYLLSAPEIEAFDQASDLAVAVPMGELARFEVAAVTGANDFFSVDDTTLADNELEPWSQPLLPRIRFAPGLVYTSDDHQIAAAAGARVHLLDFSAARDDPLASAGPRRYLASGAAEDLHLRYKCRIRVPWFRVPQIRAGQLLLSKRSHQFPRVVCNAAEAVTTDTIYRGTIQECPAPSVSDVSPDGAADLAAVFHNSLTLLSAELEGRSFGGGVLELVPSEIGRLRVPFVAGFGAAVGELDALARTARDPDALVDETDRRLVERAVGLDRDLVDRLRDARVSLRGRRLERNAQPRPRSAS